MEEQLSNKIFELKDKLTDGEFKDLMDTLKGVYEEKKETEYVLYEIEYVIPKVSIVRTNVKVELKQRKKIIKLRKNEMEHYYGAHEKNFLQHLEEHDNLLCIDSFAYRKLIDDKSYIIDGGFIYCEECGENICENPDCDNHQDPQTFKLYIETEHIQILKHTKLY